MRPATLVIEVCFKFTTRSMNAVDTHELSANSAGAAQLQKCEAGRRREREWENDDQERDCRWAPLRDNRSSAIAVCLSPSWIPEHVVHNAQVRHSLGLRAEMKMVLDSKLCVFDEQGDAPRSRRLQILPRHALGTFCNCVCAWKRVEVTSPLLVRLCCHIVV